MEDGASMLSNPTTKESDPRAQVMIDPAIVLAARADRAVGAEPARRRSEHPTQMVEIPPPAADAGFRSANVRADGDTPGRSAVTTWAIRTIMAVLFAVCSAVAAAAWQTYGDQAQEVIGQWVPRISLSSAKTASLAQPAADGAATDDQATAVAASEPAGTTSAPAAGATPSPDSAELLQSMARDLAAMSQQIGELKANIAQLKAGQDQMSHDMARVVEARASDAKPFDPRAIEQTLRPKPPVPRPAPVATAPVHRPRPATTASATASAVPAAAAPVPLQSAPPPAAAPTPDQGSIVRPPMPVR
jgi:hypothetical protein